MAKGRSYLYLGPEIGEKQDAVAELKRRLGGKAGEAAVETLSFYAGETPVTDMVAILRNGSLFSDARLVLIKNAETLKSAESARKREDVELLASYMEAPQDDTVLVLVSEEIKLDSRLEKAADPKDKRIFWELFENRKAEWVENYFRREGFRISAGGIDAVLELVENNTDALRRECSHLMLFLGKDRPADAADVEKWLSHTREESVFTLFSKIASGDLTRGIEILRTLLAAKTSTYMIIAGLAGCFRKLRDYRRLREAGISDEFEFKKIGLASSKARKDYAAALERGLDASRCLALAAEYDFRIRSTGTASESVLMDLLVCKLTAPRGPLREKWYYY
ncbi:MAG: DNA polymerase III subunit delta [Spirochaetaceae bacterium]|jgi:DNA polymerase-3 subunit delta|nr:DNA polymerase III subunit delta [Spirochaetaceae bacterium]